MSCELLELDGLLFFSSAGARDRVIAVANVGDKCESCTL